jgi:hypothetical protein
LLTEIRETESAAAEKRRMVEAIEDEVSGCTRVIAYRRVMEMMTGLPAPDLDKVLERERARTYMPDFKLWDPEHCRMYLVASDYADAARATIAAMHAQVGELKVDEEGLALRGVLVRHLVMPGLLDDTREIMRWLASNLSRDTYVNVMDQYYPAHKSRSQSALRANRPPASQERIRRSPRTGAIGGIVAVGRTLAKRHTAWRPRLDAVDAPKRAEGRPRYDKLIHSLDLISARTLRAGCGD